MSVFSPNFLIQRILWSSNPAEICYIDFRRFRSARSKGELSQHFLVDLARASSSSDIGEFEAAFE